MYRKILVPLDGSELAECVLPHAESITKGCGVETVTFVRVSEPINIPYAGEYGFSLSAQELERMESDSKAAARKYLDQLITRVTYDGVYLQTEVLSGRKAAEMIVVYATKNETDLIVMATHGSSGPSLWDYGNIADKILHGVSSPIFLVRPK